ncbi:hypothetical protein GQ55_2G471800 [Panicum hallii var. hallii]|uniref:Uncharacterized protein n=1 Tax=Panicum hallii var. hallii TaxID=1504633 RepID=A0A2T7F005_9POAL|nr:hypothetical protein GQ55_2G471800 [Panicum hallii var. hallii]
MHEWLDSIPQRNTGRGACVCERERVCEHKWPELKRCVHHSFILPSCGGSTRQCRIQWSSVVDCTCQTGYRLCNHQAGGSASISSPFCKGALLSYLSVFAPTMQVCPAGPVSFDQP